MLVLLRRAKTREADLRSVGLGTQLDQTGESSRGIKTAAEPDPWRGWSCPIDISSVPAWLTAFATFALSTIDDE